MNLAILTELEVVRSPRCHPPLPKTGCCDLPSISLPRLLTSPWLPAPLTCSPFPEQITQGVNLRYDRSGFSVWVYSPFLLLLNSADNLHRPGYGLSPIRTVRAKSPKTVVILHASACAPCHNVSSTFDHNDRHLDGCHEDKSDSNDMPLSATCCLTRHEVRQLHGIPTTKDVRQRQVSQSSTNITTRAPYTPQ
jgi:hypothetical protein